MVDVIEIDDSDDETVSYKPPISDEQPPNNQQNYDPHAGTKSQDIKPQVITQNDIKSESQFSSNDLLESRRKKIDQLLDVYIKYHHRLISIEHMMTPEQTQRWQSHLATSYGSVSSSSYLFRKTSTTQSTEQSETPLAHEYQQPRPSTSSGLQRPTWFIDSPTGGESANHNTRSRTTAPRARRAPRRKRRYVSTTASKSKAKKPKRTAATWVDPVVSRKPKSTTATSRPKPSTSKTQTDKKPKVTKLQAMLAKVKKER